MKTSKRTYAVIVAAGRGSRMGSDLPKQLLPYRGGTILEHTVKQFYRNENVDVVVVVGPEDGSLDTTYREMMDGISGPSGQEIIICHGGDSRFASVFQGVLASIEDAEKNGINSEDAIVMIHDAARPGVDDGVISRNLEGMKTCRAVVTALPSIDSIRFAGGWNGDKTDKKTSDSGHNSLKESMEYPIIESNVVERKYVYNVQTPQTFWLKDIYEAHMAAQAEGYVGTDDASVAEHAGINVAIVEGSRANNKITTQEDLPMSTRVGTGFDVHRLVPGRDLILCGTPVPYEVGLLGHSDADVATHALMDALLGAAGKGDIGQHFPDTDIRYKGANSMHLLAEVREMLSEYRIVNVDVTIIAQAPKLAPYNAQMRANIARTLGIEESAVNIKATTTEGLGFTGNKEGIAALATCAIEGGL